MFLICRSRRSSVRRHNVWSRQGLHTVETADQDTGGRTAVGVIFFCDPPNGEIIEQLLQMERATERRMVAVHKIVFPEDAATTAQIAGR